MVIIMIKLSRNHDDNNDGNDDGGDGGEVDVENDDDDNNNENNYNNNHNNNNDIMKMIMKIMITIIITMQILQLKEKLYMFYCINSIYYSDFTETIDQLNPWWAVDLGRPVELTNLVVHNRKDCCGMYCLNSRRHIQGAACFANQYVDQIKIF